MPTPWNEPFERFGALFERAKHSQPKDPNAMSLGTVDAHGNPTVRVVLLKDFDAQGFVFYTNQTSRKGHELIGQRVAALMFYWPSLEEQVRVEGQVAQVGAAESDAYFATRSRSSQLGAWASHQSQPMASRAELEARLVAVTKQYEGQAVPRPGHWGGFRLAPERIEFWRAHPDRLHWREQYAKAGQGWVTSILNP
jgi:pyridoxamine 5'-phosphate oxidase